jgi:hypothetical protein
VTLAPDPLFILLTFVRSKSVDVTVGHHHWRTHKCLAIPRIELLLNRRCSVHQRQHVRLELYPQQQRPHDAPRPPAAASASIRHVHARGTGTDRIHQCIIPIISHTKS